MFVSKYLHFVVLFQDFVSDIIPNPDRGMAGPDHTKAQANMARLLSEVGWGKPTSTYLNGSYVQQLKFSYGPFFGAIPNFATEKEPKRNFL